MKRVIVLSLAVAFALSSLAACSEDRNPVEGKKKQEWRTKGKREVNPELGKLR